jgi:hypothetical protein
VEVLASWAFFFSAFRALPLAFFFEGALFGGVACKIRKQCDG